MYQLNLTKEQLDVLAYVVGDEEVKQFIDGRVPADDFGFFDTLREIEQKIEEAKAQ